MITYQPRRDNGDIPILLEGRRVGTISPVSGGEFRYLPFGHKRGGENFPSIDAVKRSLEAA